MLSRNGFREDLSQVLQRCHGLDHGGGRRPAQERRVPASTEVDVIAVIGASSFWRDFLPTTAIARVKLTGPCEHAVRRRARGAIVVRRWLHILVLELVVVTEVDSSVLLLMCSFVVVAVGDKGTDAALELGIVPEEAATAGWPLHFVFRCSHQLAVFFVLGGTASRREEAVPRGQRRRRP